MALISRRVFLFGTIVLSAAITSLFVSCNDNGTSPFAPHIAYKRSEIAGQVGVAIVPDTLVSDGGAVTGSFSVNPSLPTGLTLNPKTGLISGTPVTLLDTAMHYAVTATGPNGSAVAPLILCVGDSTHFCDLRAPQVSYGLSGAGGDPGFMWTTVNVPVTADTPVSFGGIVTAYAPVTALPAGVSLNSATGVISGTPSGTSAAKDYQIVATGPNGADTEVVYIGVYPTGYPVTFLKNGEAFFEAPCAGCHGRDGKGAVGPPYYHSDYLSADNHRPIRIVLQGLPNFVDTALTIYVNGSPVTATSYQTMPIIGGSDSSVASVLTFVRAMFTGATDYITPDEVEQERDSMRTACARVNPSNNPSVCDTGSFNPNY